MSSLPCSPYSCLMLQWQCCLERPPVQNFDLTSPVEIRLIVSRIFPSVNLFSYARNQLEQSWVLSFSGISNAILITFTVLHFLIIVACLIILALPYLRRSRSNQRVKVGWIFKRVYIQTTHKKTQSLPGNGSDSIQILPNPLILINSGVVVAVCQLISSVLYEIFLILTLSSFQWQDSTTQTPFRAWGAALVLFEFYAFWAIAWTSIYTRLYTEDSYFKKVQRWPYKIFQPLTMNFFFISISILATVLAPIHIYYLAKGFVDNGDHYAAALNSFDSGSIVWEMFNSSINANNSNIWDVNVNALQRLSGALSNSSEKSFTLIVASIDLINKERVITYFWLFFIFAALLLYAIGTQKLLCSINSELSGKKVEIEVVSNRGDTSSSFTNHSVRKLEDQVALRKSRYYLTCYSTLFIIAGLFDMAMRIFQIVKAQEISGQRRWSIIRGWLVLFNGAFIAIAVTFQCWRTFVDFDIIIPINGPNASRKEQEPLSPLK